MGVPLLALVVSPPQAAAILLPVLCLTDLVGFRVYSPEVADLPVPHRITVDLSRDAVNLTARGAADCLTPGSHIYSLRFKTKGAGQSTRLAARAAGVGSLQGFSLSFQEKKRTMKHAALSAALLALGTLSAACSASTTSNTAVNVPAANSANVTASNTTPANTAPAARTTGSLADPKSSIAYQFELLKAGDVDKLKNCFTARARDGVTKEAVDKGKGQSAAYSIDDLYASAEMGEADGKKTAKVKMKNGRTLTTLVETNGEWLADTIWFK